MKKKKLEIRIAGSGGQGVILCTIILAEASLYDWEYVAQAQAYGPEARGGACKAELVVSDHLRDYPKVDYSDFLMCLSQKAVAKYGDKIKEGSTVILDSSLDASMFDGMNCRLIMLPVLKSAEELGNPMCANIIAAGITNACLKLSDEESLEKAVVKYVPGGSRDLNIKAVQFGAKLYDEASKN